MQIYLLSHRDTMAAHTARQQVAMISNALHGTRQFRCNVVPRPQQTRDAWHKPQIRMTQRVAASTQASPISLTDQALAHLRKLQAEQPNGERLLLRLGVRNGGCNGMSYEMDFEKDDNITSDDNVVEVEGFRMVCSNKSLLYLFGLELDYSDALIGGGFAFRNPNSKGECGCGKSFSV